ncbi:MAG TPA: hypothetical protein VKB18_03855 [Gemmatimonadota bacterium]|nr:hypothetical protein [Gemmatimonadota bacterium]
MFEGLKKRLERALDALERKGPGPSEDEIDRLLSGMREELIDVRARVKALEDEEASVTRRLERASSGSEVEARLRRKLEDVRKVLAEMRAEASELTARFKEAMGSRDALAARGRRTRASEHLREEAGGAVREFDRAAEHIEDEERLSRAERDLDEELDPGGTADVSGEAWDRGARERHAERLLDELKRRMGVDEEEGGGEGSGREDAAD